MDSNWRTHDLTIETGQPALDWLDREWLLTNGTGAYAMGTAPGINTRRYHGLLVAATKPPVGRVVTVNQMLEQLTVKHAGKEQSFDFSSCSFRASDGNEVLSPQGHTMLTRFERGLSVRWTYRAAVDADLDIEFTRQLCLHWQEQAATLHYALRAFSNGKPADLPQGVLYISPMLTLRDFHATLRMQNAGSLSLEIKDNGVATVHRQDTAVTLQCDTAKFVGINPAKSDPWWHDVHYELETRRGQDDVEDYFVPGRYEAEFKPCAEVKLALTLAFGDQPAKPCNPDQADRGKYLAPVYDHLKSKGDRDELLSRAFAIAADDFIVTRRFRDKPLKTVLAGYPWFADWGRDTQISLPGLLLATGRFEEARSTLEVFAAAIKDGLVPNRFDDFDPTAAHYNSVDASMWFVHAAMEYVRLTKDKQSWDGWLADAAVQVVDAFLRGTVYDIRMSGDGLITAGSPDTQLTWMDAACNGVVFTPRHGKAVEINALWYNALVGLAELFATSNKPVADHYTKLAKRVKRAFAKVFWDDELGYLRDHTWTDEHGEEHTDRSLRPNQVFAVSLPRSPLPLTKQRLVLKAVQEQLLTPFGLRTLPTDDPNYHGRYTGPPFERDKAYHQGTVWPWLIGPYAEGVLRVGKFSPAAKQQARQVITPLIQELTQRGLGQLHEIHEGDAPHRQVGCMAQAWSIAEVLRVYTML